MCRVDCSQQRMLTLTGTPDPRVTVGCTCISTWSQCLPWCTVSFNSISYHITTDLNTKFLSGSRRVNWYLTSLQEQFWKRSNTTRAFPICWGVSDEFWCLPLVFSMTRQGHFTSGSVSEDIGCFFFPKHKESCQTQISSAKNPRYCIAHFLFTASFWSRVFLYVYCILLSYLCLRAEDHPLFFHCRR